MKAAVKKSSAPKGGGEWVPVSVSFGSVTVRVDQPPESVRRANVEAGQAALRRGKAALLKPGVKLTREKGIPLYFGCDDRPGWMVRELDGKKTVGRFSSGRFVVENQSTSKNQPTTTSKKRIVKS